MNAVIEENSIAIEEQSAPTKKFRVQLDFEPADMETINNLVAELHLGTRAELFRSGLRTLRWMVKKRKEGCAIVAVSPDERYFEPEFEFLDAIPFPLPQESGPAQSVRDENARDRQPALV